MATLVSAGVEGVNNGRGVNEMNKTGIGRLLGIAVIAVGLAIPGFASAWYGDPWYRPYGSGAMVYKRQNMMRGHGYTMSQLADMLEGRRILNRTEAVRLARELEAGFGGNLIGNFAPGTVVAGSRTAPSAWRNFGAFRGYAEAAKQASSRLAEALDRAPSGKDVQQTASGAPPRRMGYGWWGHRPAGLVPMEALQEFGRLTATCNSCHAWFRGPRR